MTTRGTEGDGTYIRKTLKRVGKGIMEVVKIEVIEPQKPPKSQRHRYSS